MENPEVQLVQAPPEAENLQAAGAVLLPAAKKRFVRAFINLADAHCLSTGKGAAGKRILEHVEGDAARALKQVRWLCDTVPNDRDCDNSEPTERD